MKTKYTAEVLAPIVKAESSILGVIRALGRRPSGGMHVHLHRLIDLHGLDTSHFRQGGCPGVRQGGRKVRPEDVLVFDRYGNGRRENIDTLRRAMLGAGFTEQCQQCGIVGEWEGKPLRLQVDHVNGLSSDNRAENLRFLCPNCHSQTSTFGARNIGRVAER